MFRPSEASGESFTVAAWLSVTFAACDDRASAALSADGLGIGSTGGPSSAVTTKRPALRACWRVCKRYFSGFVPAIQMITRLNFPSASMSKKLQLCMSFFVPSFELADVALLRGDLAELRVDDDVLDLVEDRDRGVAEVGEHPADLVGPVEHRVVGLDGEHTVVGEVGQDRVHVLRPRP